MVSVFCVVLVGLAVAVLAAPEEKYNQKYDSIDIDALIRNERLLKKSFDCLMDRGGCTPDVMELKKNLPDALQNGCSKCSEKQKAGAEKMLKFLIEKKKEQFDELQKKYDPEGVYQKKYEEMAEKKGIKM